MSSPAGPGDVQEVVGTVLARCAELQAMDDLSFDALALVILGKVTR